MELILYDWSKRRDSIKYDLANSPLKPNRDEDNQKYKSQYQRYRRLKL